MIGIISSLALLTMFIPIIIGERSHAKMSHASYQRRFDNKPISKDERLSMIATELTLHTNIKYIATHGCVICQTLGELFTMPEALAHLQSVRATAF